MCGINGCEFRYLMKDGNGRVENMMKFCDFGEKFIFLTHRLAFSCHTFNETSRNHQEQVLYLAQSEPLLTSDTHVQSIVRGQLVGHDKPKQG